MLEKTRLAATQIADLPVLNSTTVADIMNGMGPLRADQLIVTNHNGTCIYDSKDENTGKALSNEVIGLALERNNVFQWDYRDGSMHSQSATPIVSYGALVGCVYMSESDVEQGALIHTLQLRTLTVTIILEIAVILFAFIFSHSFSLRLQTIMTSFRIIRKGDYTHRIKLRGNDELTELAEEFNELTERLYESEQQRRNFVSDASHELKTPLASIKLLSDSIMQNDMDVETIREFVGDIGNEADRLNRMSQKLLTLSRTEAETENNFEIVYIGPAVERAIRMLSATAAQNSVAIQTDLSGDSSILVMEDDLYQIVFNLIENGIKYNRKDGALTVRIQREDDNAVLTVTDTGVGIPEESLPHIFDRFYRVDKARSRSTGGAGLGLSIVRSLVERNNGTIRADSTPNIGTTFTVVFPIFDMEEPYEADQLEC